MKQVWITAKGAPETLQVREAPDPQAAAGQLRIRVAFAGINFADIQARMGQYPDAPPVPCVVGYEVAGIVDQVGGGVSDFSAGDRVLSFTRFGGYSDTVVVDAAWAHKVPDHVSLEAAAAIPVNYATAWTMLIRLGALQPGETVLVHSAGGGVGIAALQICQWRGAIAIGTASAGKHARLKDLGYAHCIDYRSQNFETEVMRYTGGRGVDVVLDPQGGNSFRRSYRCLAPLGRLFMFGMAGSVQGEKLNPLALLRELLTTPWFHPLSLLNNRRALPAASVHMSASTLQAKLARVGLTFRQLLDETRHELALGYIEQSRLSITEIAFMLGFSDLSNFIRAFRRWTGKSPTEFRGHSH